ncbi:unnamed protein product, partial [Iphiclides podalirius]
MASERGGRVGRPWPRCCRYEPPEPPVRNRFRVPLTSPPSVRPAHPRSILPTARRVTHHHPWGSSVTSRDSAASRCAPENFHFVQLRRVKGVTSVDYITRLGCWANCYPFKHADSASIGSRRRTLVMSCDAKSIVVGEFIITGGIISARNGARNLRFKFGRGKTAIGTEHLIGP